MTATVATTNAVPVLPGDLGADVRETHTGVVVLLGDKAYKTKKSVVTDFLDFSTPERRERACEHEVRLNSRLAPESYLGLAHFTDPNGGPAEPVIVMRRYPDSRRLASLVIHDQPVEAHLVSIAAKLARFHGHAARGRSIDACATVDAITARWQENLDERQRHAGTVVQRESIEELERLVRQYIAGRSTLFTQRIAEGRIVDGHADLLADDIFCMPEGPVLLDCLEFDDELRYVDGIDDAAFLAMDLEFLGRKDLGDYFLGEYSRLAGDAAPRSLKDFYIAYRAVVRAKVDCVRVSQGHPDAVSDARRHIDIALEHLRAGTVRLIMIGGGPGTGKSTLARALAKQIGAQVISTDDVRRQLQRAGAVTGTAGVLDEGLYSAENVAAVYNELLRYTHDYLVAGQSVILDGTWRDARQRDRARKLADDTAARTVEFTCSVPLDEAAARIQNRSSTTSDATPQIAAALAQQHGGPHAGHPINTRQPLADSVAEAEQILLSERAQ
ncbi:MAG TPA: nucleoside monophosphate kinase [Mycobacterium sp.]|nr:nucleoside monophosphate kinase [Mycobacterium sp.]